jgi:hypothetical protein
MVYNTGEDMRTGLSEFKYRWKKVDETAATIAELEQPSKNEYNLKLITLTGDGNIQVETGKVNLKDMSKNQYGRNVTFMGEIASYFV